MLVCAECSAVLTGWHTGAHHKVIHTNLQANNNGLRQRTPACCFDPRPAGAAGILSMTFDHGTML
jgi:hypothetical protein